MNGSETDAEDGHILHNLMMFGEVLRRLGLDFGSGNMLDLVRATRDIPMGRRQDFQNAARCLLVHRKQDIPVFDDAFKVFWRRPSHGISTRDLRSMGEERRYPLPAHCLGFRPGRQRRRGRARFRRTAGGGPDSNLQRPGSVEGQGLRRIFPVGNPPRPRC